MLRDYPMMHMARDAGLLALHDAGMTLADVDEAIVGYIQPASMLGIKAMKELGLTGPAGHPHRERVGDRAGGVPRGGVGGVVGPGRRRDGAVLRQVHRDGGHRWSRRRTRRDRRADPARVVLRAVGAAPHARARHDARALRQDRGEELELRRGLARCRTGSPTTWSRPRRCSASRMVAEPLTTMMCCPADDGAACVILARDDLVRRAPARSPARAPAGVGAAVGDLRARAHVRRAGRRAVDDDRATPRSSATRRPASGPTT